jgi:pseudouridine kinase
MTDLSANDGHVLVIGSAGIDIKAKTLQDIQWEQSNPGIVRNSVGGVARNIGENLARLEVKTVLLSAIGRDAPGRLVLRKSEQGGVDVSHVRVVRDGRTGTFVTLLKPNGDKLAAVHDFDIMEYVNRAYLTKHIDLFAKARMIVIDMNLNDEALATVFELAGRFNVRVAADPTTPLLAGRLCDFLPQLYLVTPNEGETAALCRLDNPATTHDTAIDAARQLVTMGAKIAVVTLGESGLAYADANGGGYIRAVRTQVVDSTGAGDALSGAVIFGLLNEVDLDEAVRLGTTAASLTLGSRETVLPDLSVELLYDKLVV